MGRKEKRRLNRLITQIIPEEVSVPEIFRVDQEPFPYPEKLDVAFPCPTKLPLHREIQDFKEEFQEVLEAVFSKYETSLADVAYERMSEPKLLSMLNIDQRRLLLNRLQSIVAQDGSVELRAMLFKRTNLFVDKVLRLIHTFDRQHSTNVKQCATQLMQICGRELDKCTRILFEKASATAQTFQRYLSSEFSKQVMPAAQQIKPSAAVSQKPGEKVVLENLSLEALVSEINQATVDSRPTSAKKPKKRQPKSLKEEIAPEDKEFQDFRNKLESQKCAKVRVKPKIHETWVSQLTTQLSLTRSESV